LDVHVVSAHIETDASGCVNNTFLVQTHEGAKLKDADLPSIKQQVLESVRFGTSRSGVPLIYGASAAVQVAALKARKSQQLQQRQQQLGQAMVDSNRSDNICLADAEVLELAAAELAVAASALVAAEKAVALAADAAIAQASAPADAASTMPPPQPTAGDDLDALERLRDEAASQLERRMAAMEAAIASRRSPKETVAERLAAARARELMGGWSTPVPVTSSAHSGRVADGMQTEDGMLEMAPPSSTVGTGPGLGSGYEIILQGFNWTSCEWKNPTWYAHLNSMAKKIAGAGFTTLWLPPATNAVSAQGYLPRDLYDLNSAYGDEGSLRMLLRTLRDVRVKSVADIVINHRCAHEQDAQGRWNKFGGRLAWDASAICSGNPQFGGTGARNTGEPYPAAPNVDHSNAKVRSSLQEWLQWMRTVGFDGWRFDYVKGYSPEFTRSYVDASVPVLAFGEFWDACSYTGGVLDYNQDSHRQRIVNWVDRTGGTSGAFDFTTKGILQEAVLRSEYWRLVDAQGRMPGLAGLWGMRAVTFIGNHDTEPPLAHWPFPQTELAQGYAYILTHPGTPCVFWDHWDEKLHPALAPIVTELISVRKRARISAKSTLVVLKASNEVYAACIDGKVVVKIGWGDYSPNAAKLEGKHWERACSGKNFAVWCSESVPKATAAPGGGSTQLEQHAAVAR